MPQKEIVFITISETLIRPVFIVCVCWLLELGLFYVPWSLYIVAMFIDVYFLIIYVNQNLIQPSQNMQNNYNF